MTKETRTNAARGLDAYALLSDGRERREVEVDRGLERALERRAGLAARHRAREPHRHAPVVHLAIQRT